jgi:hypothetical protein
VKYEMLHHIGNNRRPGIVTEGQKKISGNNNKKALNSFCTANNCARDIALNKESATV